MNLSLSNEAMITGVATFLAVCAWGVLAHLAEAANQKPSSRLWQGGAGSWYGRMRATRRQRLERAGLRTPRSRLAYSAGVLAAILVGAVLGAAFAGPTSTAAAIAWAGGGALVGRIGGRAWLASHGAKVQASLAHSMPLALELLCIGVNGGLSLGAAWRRAADGLASAKDPLAAQLSLVELDVRLGKPWRKALEEAAARTGVTSMSDIGQLLEHAERFGSELAPALQVGIDSLRHDEMQDHEERAHRNSVRMLVPLAACLLPVTLLLILGPLIALVVQSLKSASPN